MPPISFPREPRTIRRPLRPFGTAAVPPGSVPIRFAATVLPADPARTSPLLPFPEMTFDTTPEAPEGLRPMTFRAEVGATYTPSPWLPDGRPARFSPT